MMSSSLLVGNVKSTLSLDRLRQPEMLEEVVGNGPSNVDT